jgi:creatinine amidohydrolase/Fe(II)-dependent formamide hydrolase-like protein
MPQILENLTRQELEALPKDRTVVLIPVGILEDHGPHLPVGLDLQEATHLTYRVATELEAAAPQWKCLIYPPTPLACDSNTDVFRTRVKGSVVREYLFGTCTSLYERGFRHFGILSGSWGPKQLTAIEEAGRAFVRWHNGFFLLKLRAPQRMVTFSSLSSALLPPGEAWRSPLIADPAEHGGKRDVSVRLAMAPQDPVARPPLLAGPESKWSRWMLRLQSKREGYWGSDPEQASREEGEAWLQNSAQTLAAKLRRVIENGEKGDKVFRSNYGYFLPNYSSFHAFGWAMLGIIILLMWVSWTIQLLMFR